jgi:methylated-DNA-[protein]-cysteine S-methyltransferase
MVTPFQRKVYAVLRKIPRGRVTTYRLLAASLGCRSARAVGQALRRNPFAPAVPCHRVIKSDLGIGGYGGRTGGQTLRRKLALLKAEGVVFNGGKLAEPGRVIRLGRLPLRAASKKPADGEIHRQRAGK